MFAAIEGIPSFQRRPARGWTVLVVGFLATVLAVLFYSSTWQTGDDGRYYVIGMSLADGAGLVQYDNPLQPLQALTQPLYPALIAAVIRLTDNPVVGVKVIGNFLFVFASLLAALVLMGSGRDARAGVLGACMGMFAVGVVAIASWVMADTLFMLFIFLSLRAGQQRPGKRTAFAVGGLAGLAFLARPAGMALGAAVLLAPVLHRQWRRLLFVALGLGLVVAPWFYWKTFIFQGPDPNMVLFEQHSRMFRGTGFSANLPLLLASECVRDIPGYLMQVIPFHFFYSAHKVAGSPGFWRLAAMGVGIGSAIGLLLRIRRWTEVDWFFIFTLGMIAAIPGPIFDNNYFFPLLPIAAFYFFTFVEWLARQVEERWLLARTARGVRLAALLLFGFSLSLDFAAGGVHFIKENPRRAHPPWAPERFLAYGEDYYDAWARVSDAATWIRNNTPPDAVLLSRKPDHLFVMSGRQGWRYDIPGHVNCTTIPEAVGKFAPDRMVLLLEDAFPTGKMPNSYGNSREHVLNETVRKAPDRWRVLYTTAEPVTRVWAYGEASGQPREE